MKKLYKGLIAAVLSITLIMSLVVTSWGAAAALADGIMGDLAKDFLKWCLTPTTVNEGEDEIVEATNHINSVWRTAGNCTGTVEVTYQTMSDLVVDLNMNGIPCQIGMWRGSGATGYVIKGTGKTPVCGGVVKVDITGKYFTNTVGAAFLAKSKSEITAPDTSTTTPTTPTINFDDTNIVNAVEGVFDQLTWVIRCQFEQMQDTLVNGRILLNINNLISKNVIPFLEDILVADSSTSSTLQALYQSFENKFSDLDNMFGTDTSMTVHNGDLMTWDNASRGFTSATADGTISTIRLTPTRTLDGYKIGWSSDGYFNIVPAGGSTFPDTLNVGTGTVTMPVITTSEKTTVPNPALNEHVPDGYTQYEKFTPYSTKPIDLGVVPVSGMQFEAGVSVTATTTNPSQPQYFFGVDGLSMAVAQNKQALEVRSGVNLYSYPLNFSNSAYSLSIYWKFGTSWRHGGMSNGITMSSFPSTSKTLYLGQANGISPIERFPQTGGGYTSTYNYVHSRWDSVTIRDSEDNLLYEFVPCKRNSDGMAGLYRVEYNAGTYTGGTFISCDDDSADFHLSNELPLTVETTVTKPGNIVRIYRDSGNFWYARSADGTTQNFDAISTVALVKAFPIYEYSSLSKMTSLPDGTYRISWSGTAQTVTINYQAYSKFFAFIANQILYNRNWWDERLDRLSLGGGSPADLSQIIAGLNSITTTQEDISSSLAALNASFEYKFSELNSIFDDGYMDEVIYPAQEVRWDADLRDNLFFSYNDSDYTVGKIAVLPFEVIPGWEAGIDGSSRYRAMPSSGIFPDTLETADGTINFPAGVQHIYCDVFADKWYLATDDSPGIAFDEATNMLLKQVFPVYVYESFGEIGNLPDGKFVMFWTGNAPFVMSHYLQHSRFFSHLISTIESTSAERLEVLTEILSLLEELVNVSDSSGCEHVYQQEMTTDATCTLPGLMVSTCTQCGDSYSEIVDPLGHDWQCTDHVAAETDSETGEETAAAYDIYTCSRCGEIYKDFSGDGAPDYENTSISKLIVELFSRLGQLAGKLVSFLIGLLDKALTSVDDIITKFNEYTEQITGFGGAYPAWLGGVWGILPTDLQVALTFAVTCIAVALVGKKLVFS